MEIIPSNPPEHILSMILRNGMKPTPTTIFTVGNKIYAPNGNINLEDHLIEHEHTHCVQQGSDPEAWWARYVTDPYFRIDQESEAYGKQYAFICRTAKDRNRRNLVALDLARFLSSPIYGSVINKEDARKMIINKSNVKK